MKEYLWKVEKISNKFFILLVCYCYKKLFVKVIVKSYFDSF